MRIFSKDIKLTNEKIDSANYISIIIHNNPDGDAVGAAVAMYKYLTNYRKKKLALFYLIIHLKVLVLFYPKIIL